MGLQFRLPRVGFVTENHDLHLPAEFRVNARVFLGSKELSPVVNPRKPYYTDGVEWNLNAGHTCYGNFGIPEECVDNTEKLWIEIQSYCD
ncbi:MAG: hypothetical protein OEY31_10400 [Candidatus Bathyarchaeota archaeon]|nr:hypothetical protein [Candidatus Bathyarchaeota archaeon]